MTPRPRLIEIGTPTAQSDNLLYTLPLELRLMIFKLVVQVLEDEPYGGGTKWLKKNGNCREPLVERLAALLSCRAIYHEACGIIYNHLEIGIDNFLPKSGEVRKFSHEHSSQKLGGVRKMLITIIEAKSARIITKLLVRCPSLKSLKFLITGDSYGLDYLTDRSLRGDRERSAVLWIRGLRLQQKALERAMSKLRSLTRLELVVEEVWAFTAVDMKQVREFEEALNGSLERRSQQTAG